MHILVGCLHVNLQFPVVRAHSHVLVVILDFYKLGVRKFFQFFEQRVGHRQKLPSVSRSVPQVMPRHEMQGHWDHGGWHPHVNVRTSSTVFIHVHANQAFVERVRTCHNERTAYSEGCLCQQHHVCLPGVSNALPCPWS